MGSSLITACINHRFQVRLSESQNGFRAIRTAVLRDLGLQENITTIEQEMIIKTLKKGYRMAEVPSHEHKRKAGILEDQHPEGRLPVRLEHDQVPLFLSPLGLDLSRAVMPPSPGGEGCRGSGEESDMD